MEFVQTVQEAIALIENGGDAARMVIALTSLDTFFIYVIGGKLIKIFKKDKKKTVEPVKKGN